jgi:hypothetical protein
MVWRMPLSVFISRGVSVLLRRLRLRGPSRSPGSVPAPPPLDPLLAAGQTLREAREAEGIGLRQLAHQTRISTVVLEALERGWRDRLPEAAYLRTMLTLLERRLQLPPGSLHGALPSEPPLRAGSRGGAGIVRFTPGSIDVFTTWQGTILYGLLILALIYGLNLQQRRLAARGLLTVGVIPPIGNSEATEGADAEASLVEAFPELRPLERAARGQGLGLLHRKSRSTATALSPGVLRLTLEQPTRVLLRPRGQKPIDLSEARGDLALSIQPPFVVTLSPPPAGEKGVIWNSRPLTPGPSPASPGGEGSATAEYRYPPAEQGPSGASPRP